MIMLYITLYRSPILQSCGYNGLADCGHVRHAILQPLFGPPRSPPTQDPPDPPTPKGSSSGDSASDISSESSSPLATGFSETATTKQLESAEKSETQAHNAATSSASHVQQEMDSICPSHTGKPPPEGLEYVHLVQIDTGEDCTRYFTSQYGKPDASLPMVTPSMLSDNEDEENVSSSNEECHSETEIESESEHESESDAPPE